MCGWRRGCECALDVAYQLGGTVRSCCKKRFDGKSLQKTLIFSGCRKSIRKQIRPSCKKIFQLRFEFVWFCAKYGGQKSMTRLEFTSISSPCESVDLHMTTFPNKLSVQSHSLQGTWQPSRSHLGMVWCENLDYKNALFSNRHVKTKNQRCYFGVHGCDKKKYVKLTCHQ